ncbi:hypothetical protein NP493_549g01000, partial [Ridgeia piscesae]
AGLPGSWLPLVGSQSEWRIDLGEGGLETLALLLSEGELLLFDGMGRVMEVGKTVGSHFTGMRS